jgi:hypothetical protein
MKRPSIKGNLAWFVLTYLVAPDGATKELSPKGLPGA